MSALKNKNISRRFFDDLWNKGNLAVADEIIVLFVCVLITISCTSISNIKNKEIPALVGNQLASGAPIYRQTCATKACHGTQGEGIRSGDRFTAWPLVGSEFQSRHPNAEIVFDVVRSGDEENLRKLTDQQIYDAIAYELSQNRITLQSPLTAKNAFTIYGESMSGKVEGGLFPPADNVMISNTPLTRNLPIAVANNRLRLQIDQIAEASTIDNARPSGRGAFLILVMVFNNLIAEPIRISPEYMKLSTPGDEILQPQSINIHSAIEQFHNQTIELQHGTAMLGVFKLSSPEQFDRLIYDDPAGNRLTLALKP